MGIDKNFEELVLKLYKESSEEIFFFEYEKQRYWLKKVRATKSNIFHKIFYELFSFEVLLPVEEKSKLEALKFETQKIEKFKALDINTPNVLYKNSEFFVLSDGGKMINSYIRKRDISKEKMYYFIDKVLFELSKIHNANEFHGGAQMRNFTYKDGKFFTIDLEDSFDKSVDLKLLQFRDLLLLLLSLTKTRASFELDYEYVINKYIEFVPLNTSFYVKLKKMTDKLSFLIRLSQNSMVKKLLGRDGRGFFKLFLALKNLENDKGKK
jgi:tRNA A-37 threonylcarbamoyl transferase component Bud32